jgi:hypothetical protein
LNKEGGGILKISNDKIDNVIALNGETVIDVLNNFENKLILS